MIGDLSRSLHSVCYINPHITNSVYGNRTKHYRKKIENQKNRIVQKKMIVLTKRSSEKNIIDKLGSRKYE